MSYSSLYRVYSREGSLVGVAVGRCDIITLCQGDANRSEGTVRGSRTAYLSLCDMMCAGPCGPIGEVTAVTGSVASCLEIA